MYRMRYISRSPLFTTPTLELLTGPQQHDGDADERDRAADDVALVEDHAVDDPGPGEAHADEDTTCAAVDQ